MSGWHTKRDIIRDLTKVTNGIADIDIDDSYIVIGNEKPKPRIEDEYYDEDPRFEGADFHHETGRTSDLDGIKKLLRMYKEYEETKEREMGVGASSANGAPYVVSKPNPLNPLSTPFEPKLSAATDRLAKEQEIRKKIDQASLDNSRKGRTQKNVAIASLLKLHSKGSSGSHEQPPAETSENIKDQDQSVRAEDNSVQESIEKVTSWLNSDHKPAASPTPSGSTPSPVPIEQGMFKKKQAGKSVASSESNVKKQPVTISKVYKPSDYAENLRNRYIQNNKPKKQPNENVWEKLQRELKEKDERILMERLNADRQRRSSAENTAS